MAKNIADFRKHLTGGGARPNLFLIDIKFPAAISQQDDPTSFDVLKLNEACQFLVKSAQLPPSDLGVIPVAFRGRELKVPGDRTFEPWTITINNSSDMYVRAAFEAWSRGINAFFENVSKMKYTDANGGSSYLTEMTVTQLSRDGVSPEKTPGSPKTTGTNNEIQTRKYRLYDCWVSSVSGVNLDYSANDQISETSVTIQYSYFDVLPLNAA
jgi:hypothetical protein